MKIDTESLNKQMNSLSECLDSYFYEFDTKRGEIEELNEATVEIIDNILSKDNPNLLWIMYGEKISELKAKIASVKALFDDVQSMADDLSFQICEDEKALKHD